MKQQKQRPVEETRQGVVRLRKQGLSFSQVAAELGISKSYAVKLSKAQSDRSLQPVTGHLGLSLRRSKFAKGLLEGKTQKRAALEAGVPTASAEGKIAPKNRKPFVPRSKRPLSATQIRKETQSVVRRLLEESPIPVVVVPFELQYCCDTVLLSLSIGTRWQHGGIKTSRGLRDVLHAIVNCVKDEARKLRIYSELDVAVNEELDSWRQRVADSLLASRKEAVSEEAHEDTGVGQEPSELEPKASKETAVPTTSEVSPKSLDRETNQNIADLGKTANKESSQIAPFETPTATDESLQRKKSGRRPISSELKRRALEAKNAGATNKRCAQILYGIKYPSPQQVKNVPSILRYYKNSIPDEG